MNTLIVKLGATGDVVRTTPVLRRLVGDVTWITEAMNMVLLNGISEKLRCLSWEQRELAQHSAYDLVINLEDTPEVASFLTHVRAQRWFGACTDATGRLTYTADSQPWFDLSLISRFGRAEADQLKLLNRRSYQDLIFEGLGWRFAGEKYLLPEALETDVSGDVAIAAEAGPVWPMKNWAYYGELKQLLQAEGLRVNVLPRRKSLLEHLGDVRNHTCVIGGDSLPMHFALGTGTRCVTIFNCTSPWEIYGYGRLTKVVSPLLSQFFYKRKYDVRGASAITPAEVFEAVISAIKCSSA
jgi:heptosyltransferase II